MPLLCRGGTYVLSLIIMLKEGNVKYSCTRLIIHIQCSSSRRFFLTSKKVSSERPCMDLYAYRMLLNASPHFEQLLVWFWGWIMHNLSVSGPLQLVASVQRTIWRLDTITFAQIIRSGCFTAVEQPHADPGCFSPLYFQDLTVLPKVEMRFEQETEEQLIYRSYRP